MLIRNPRLVSMESCARKMEGNFTGSLGTLNVHFLGGRDVAKWGEDIPREGKGQGWGGGGGAGGKRKVCQNLFAYSILNSAILLKTFSQSSLMTEK